MKIRLFGLPDEVEQAVPLIEGAFDVVEPSDPYPSRGNSRQVRVYMEVRLPRP
ncbi:hypothetical protein [Streptosporangium jomthongense]|uniref:Uncharacterized protein n=1 Tax=Streptosporangium jomthongense TaxID=1193683 RepID=A0ABV8F3I1_9ACTN